MIEEVEVVKRTFDFLLEESNYQLWIDNHPAYAKLNPKDYSRHNINIKGFIPDLIGFNQFEDIIAMKLKEQRIFTKVLFKLITHEEKFDCTWLLKKNCF